MVLCFTLFRISEELRLLAFFLFTCNNNCKYELWYNVSINMNWILIKPI